MITLYLGEPEELVAFYAAMKHPSGIKVNQEGCQEGLVQKLITPDLFGERSYIVTTFALWKDQKLVEQLQEHWQKKRIKHKLILLGPTKLNHPFKKALEKADAIFPIDSATLLPQLVTLLAKEHGVTFSKEAMEELLFRTEGKIHRLQQEIKKLADFCGEKKRISQEMVTRLVEDEGQEPFGIQNALKSRNPSALAEAIRRGVHHGVHPHAILAICMGEWRRMLILKTIFGENTRFLEKKSFFQAVKMKEKELQEAATTDATLARWVSRPYVLYHTYRGSLNYTRKELQKLMMKVSQWHEATRAKLSDQDLLAQIIMSLRRVYGST